MYKKYAVEIVVQIKDQEVAMKKIFLFFVIFTLFGVLAAQEVQNGPAAADNGEKAGVEQPAPEEAEEESGTAPAEAQADEDQGSEVPNTPQEEEKVPEITEKPVEPEQKEVHEETPAKTEPEECACECPACPAAETFAKDDKPSKVFYQPSAGLGIGASIFSFRINNDIDFLLKHTAGGTDVYLGLEIDFRYSPYINDHSIYEIPLQLNFLFDFPLNNRNVKRLALWFSGGVDLAFGYLSYYDYGDEYDDDDKDRDSRFKLLAAWGMGLDLIFHNDVFLKLGFDSFYGKYPDLVCVAGYRF